MNSDPTLRFVSSFRNIRQRAPVARVLKHSELKYSTLQLHPFLTSAPMEESCWRHVPAVWLSQAQLRAPERWWVQNADQKNCFTPTRQYGVVTLTQ